MNKRIIITFIMICLLLVACSDDQAKSDNKKKAEGNKQEQKEKDTDIPKAPRDIQATLNQEQGIMIDKLMQKKKSMNEDEFDNYYEETFKPKMEKKVANYVKKHPKASAGDFYDYLVYLLGGTGYGEAVESIKAFTPKFEEPDFPSGPDSVTTKDGEKMEKKSNAVLLIDASGSMKAKLGGETQMEIAKDAIKEFAESLSDKTKVSLIVYGHVGTGSDADKKKSCSAIETMYKLDNYNSNKFSKALDSFSASGWTPLAGAINKAKEVLKPYQGKKYKNTVYIVSDGVETCGGNPVKAAKKLTNSNIDAKVNIIGFDVDNKGQRQLKKVAEAGNGNYVTVHSKEELSEKMTEEWRPSMLDLAWIHTEKVGVWEKGDEMDRLVKRLDKFKNPSLNQWLRISDATLSLMLKDFSKSDRLDKVMELKDNMHEMRKEFHDQLRDKKMKEMEAEIERISNIVEEWKAQWEN